MKVNNTLSFRKFYKEAIAEDSQTNRNPDFAGRSRLVNGVKEYGFFSLFHGPRGKMANLLKTILEMARDSQALYEFMQNAVDAESSDFLMFHHSDNNLGDYLVVLNNGKVFDLDGICSILDIGASTKFGNADTIGQFGVGFKLAHRLVGEDAGLEELLQDNKGPILFSWDKNELTELANPLTELQPVNANLEGTGDESKCNSSFPWLFKILYTNFPCLPGEQIIDAQERNTTEAFNNDEWKLLKRVAEVCIARIESLDFTHGTLLLIPLHKAKIKEITQPANADGLPITATILSHRKGHKQLERVVLNTELLKSAQIEVRPYHIAVNVLDGITLDEQKKLLNGVETIELYFCYSNPASEQDPFDGRPQFYLYFPMTEERHGFRFALHCNAFSFSSARTALQENSERNRLLFRIFAAELNNDLKSLASENKDVFLHIYSSLVLSKPGQNTDIWKPNREWLENDFWQPLMDVVKKNIPIYDNESFLIANGKDNVYIKDSRLPLQEWLPSSYRWFYWNRKDNSNLCDLSSQKLAISYKNIFDAIDNPVSHDKINTWLCSSPDNAEGFIQEMEELLIKEPFKDWEEGKLSSFWLEKVAKLKMWWVGDRCYSAKDLAALQTYKPEDAKKANKIIQYGPLTEIKDILEKIGLQVSKISLDNYEKLKERIRKHFQNLLPYVLKHDALTNHLNPFFSANIITKEEKKRVFLAFYKAVGTDDKFDRISKHRELSLFTNKRNPPEVKKLRSLISTSAPVPSILNDWRIDIIEADSLDLEEYLAKTPIEIYNNVILEFWPEIAAINSTPEQREELFKYISSFYSDGMQLLPVKNIFFSKEGFVPNSLPHYYHERLADSTDYESLCEAANITGLGALPQLSLFKFYKQHPFLLPQGQKTNLNFENFVSLPVEKMKALLSFSLSTDVDFFKKYLIIEDNSSIQILKNTSKIELYSTEDSSIKKYVQDYHQLQLRELPVQLATVAGTHVLYDGLLISWLINHQPSDRIAIALLAEILMRASDPDKKAFLSKQQPFDLDAELYNSELEEKLLKLTFLLSSDNIKSVLDKLLYLVEDGNKLLLSSLTNRGSDSLTINILESLQSFSIAALLGGKQNIINGRLTEAAKRWANIGISSAQTIEEALAIKQERNPSEVFAEMILQCNKLLQNSEQLRFSLTHTLSSPLLLSGINVNTNAGPSLLAKKVYYWHSVILEQFIPNALMLTADYQPFDTKGIDKHVTLSNSPVLDSFGNLDIPGLNSISDALRQNAFLKFFWGLWFLSGKPAKINWRSGNNEWKNLIGFNPSVLLLDAAVALAEETLSWDNVPFENNTENQAFLETLGAQNINSDVAKLRHNLINKQASEQITITDKNWAIATLIWLSRNNISVELEQVESLYITANILANDPLPPVPCITPAGHCFYLIEQVSETFYVTKEQVDRLKEKGIAYSKLASVAGRNIIPYNHCIRPFDSRLLKVCKPLEIKWSVVDWAKIMTSSALWTNNAYVKWKQADAVRPEIFAFNGSLPVNDLVYGESINSYPLGDVADLGKTKFVINISKSEKSLVIELSNKYPNAANWQTLIQLMDEDATYFQQIIALAKTRTETMELLEKLIKDVKDTEEREQKARLVEDRNAWYTMEWFMSLLDLVKAQERKVGLPDIKFHKCNISAEGPNIYELSETEGNIPTGIEDFPSINANIVYRNDDGALKDYSISLQAHYRYRKLKVHFPQGLPAYVTPTNIASVTLSFINTVDLIAELKSAFRRLNLSAKVNLKLTLSPNIEFLFGPPGTGKTTTLARRIISRMDTIGSKGPIIVLTPTNKAANVLVRKIIEESGDAASKWLIRAGNCMDSDLLQAGVVQNDLVINAQTSKVVITTIHRFCYQKVRRNANDTADTILCDCPWLQVIFDESSMIPLAYVTHAIHARQQAFPATEFLVAGDPLQIPPVFDLLAGDLDDVEELQLQNIYKMVGLESFNPEEQKTIPIYGEQGKITNLPTQHRSIPAIGELFSKFQYGGKVGHSRGTPEGRKTAIPRPLPKFFDNILRFKPITLIRYKVKPGETVYNPRHLNKSPLHIYISLLISEMVKKFRKEVELEKMDPWSLGILAPYRGQASLMGNLIDGHNEKSSQLNTTIDTVHGFQGDQNDIVFAVLNPTNSNAARSRFLKKPYIINVAISRAEDYLVLFVPDDNTDGMDSLPYIQNLLSIIHSLPKDQWCEINASDIEKEILPSHNYIENFSFITAHQNVNVYGKPLHPYFIRLCNNAVDVHWEDIGIPPRPLVFTNTELEALPPTHTT